MTAEMTADGLPVPGADDAADRAPVGGEGEPEVAEEEERRRRKKALLLLLLRPARDAHHDRDLVPPLPPADQPAPRDPRLAAPGLRHEHLRRQQPDGRSRSAPDGRPDLRRRDRGRPRRPRLRRRRGTRSRSPRRPETTGAEHVPVWVAIDPLTERGLRHRPARPARSTSTTATASTSGRSRWPSRSRAGSRWGSPSTRPAALRRSTSAGRTRASQVIDRQANVVRTHRRERSSCQLPERRRRRRGRQRLRRRQQQRPPAGLRPGRDGRAPRSGGARARATSACRAAWPSTARAGSSSSTRPARASSSTGPRRRTSQRLDYRRLLRRRGRRRRASSSSPTALPWTDVDASTSRTRSTTASRSGATELHAEGREVKPGRCSPPIVAAH